MAYSDSFPATRPVFQADFANGGRVDPRITFSRSTTGSFYGKDKHLSSENLLTYSSDVSQSAWTKDGLSETGGQAAPDGGTDAYKLTEDSATGFHRIYYASAVLSSGSLTVSCYVKYIGRQWVYLRLRDGGATYRHVWFDVQNGTKGTEETNMTGSITASGGGYYKLTATVSSVYATSADVRIGGANANGNTQYAGSGSDAFAVWGIQANTTGETVLNETSGQIHREYAPTLQTASINAPRFEHSATDSASEAMGQSRGLLIEGSSTNLLPYSSDASQLSGVKNEVESNVAIAPDGTLTADKMRVDDAVGTGNSLRIGTWSVTSGQKYTISYYAKAAELGFIVINFRNLNSAFASAHAYYNLNTGTVDANSGLDSYGMESCGNGWYRCWATATATATATGTYYLWAVNDAAGTPIDRDGYSGVLIWGGQIENQSFPSSYIATSGSTVTRAADSASLVSSSLFDNGSGAVFVESSSINKLTDYSGIVSLNDGSGSNSVELLNYFSYIRGTINASGVQQVSEYGASFGSNVPFKACITYDTNNVSLYANGSEIGATDTSAALPSVDRITLGNLSGGGNYLNGHLKRVAVYSDSISETSAAALTS